MRGADPRDLQPSAAALERAAGARVAVLMHYLPPYQLAVLQHLAAHVGELRVFLSTSMEPNRQWEPSWGDLDVTVQKGFTFRRKWKHALGGFEDDAFIHVPTDTVQQVLSMAPDVVISFELGARTLASLLASGGGRRRGLVVTTWMSEHCELGRGALRAAARRLIVRGADVVTYNGPSCRRYLRSVGTPEGRLLHLPYAPNPDALYRGPVTREPSAARRLLYVGQLAQRKGVAPMLDELIRFARADGQRSVRLDVAGAGPLEGALRSTSLPANLEVTFLGSLDHEQLRQAYRRAGILIFPTLADEWGLVVNEAMAAGVPVVGSRYSQAVETLCDHGDNGWVFDPQVPGALAGVLAEVWAAPDGELETMRTRARATVEAQDPAHAGSQMVSAVARALESGG